MQQQGEAPFCTDEMTEKSVFLAGISDIRHHLDMPRAHDPVFVVWSFLKRLEIYTGMDSIADNAAQTRAAARTVIIHMRSNFHESQGYAQKGVGQAKAR